VLLAAAVCPYPPVIVPEVAAGAARELDALRACCDAAVRRLIELRPELVVAVGPGPEGSGVREYDSKARGSLVPYGVDLAIGPSHTPRALLPLSLTVGAWLLQRSGWTGDRRFVAVGADLEPEACRAVGERLVTLADRVALLVLGDGSARRTEGGPGHLDARAAEYDAAIRGALELGDAGTLADLDPRLAADLLVGGRPAWQVLAGAAGDAQVEARVLADEAPYGVGYFVATWIPS
jgi:hypothetical protein